MRNPRELGAMSGAMTTYLHSYRWPEALRPISPFSDQTHRWLALFEAELAATGSGRPFPTAIVMASDLLILELGEDGARWDQFELSRLFRFVAKAMPTSIVHLARFKETLVAFLAFLARSGVVPADLAERASLTALPHGALPLEEAQDVVSLVVDLGDVEDDEAPVSFNRAQRRRLARSRRRSVAR